MALTPTQCGTCFLASESSPEETGRRSKRYLSSARTPAMLHGRRSLAPFPCLSKWIWNHVWPRVVLEVLMFSDLNKTSRWGLREALWCALAFMKLGVVCLSTYWSKTYAVEMLAVHLLWIIYFPNPPNMPLEYSICNIFFHSSLLWRSAIKQFPISILVKTHCLWWSPSAFRALPQLRYHFSLNNIELASLLLYHIGNFRF